MEKRKRKTKLTYRAALLSCVVALGVYFVWMGGAKQCRKLASVGAAALELYQEYPAPDEAAKFSRQSRIIHKIQERLSSEGKISRALHAKSLGCVKGEFQVSSSRAADSRFGVFAEDVAFPAWIRFSNASGSLQGDGEKDLRGMAIKLLGVPGEKLLPDDELSGTQDFLMTNAPVHFASDSDGVVNWAEASSKGTLSKLAFFATHPGMAATIIGGAKRKVLSLLSESYWSRVPFRIGSKAMKFKTAPCGQLATPATPASDDTYLTDDLKNRLRKSGACFDFYIQFQMHPESNPIEDASVEWKESESPFHLVATLVIPAQKFDSPEQFQFCDGLRFNPWHGLKEHQPLGDMNRARKVVYSAGQGLRTSGPSRQKEPDGSETFP